jgi:transposase
VVTAALPSLASRFGVSKGWAEKLMRQLRQTGLTERPTGGRRGPASKITLCSIENTESMLEKSIGGLQ